MTLFEKIIKKEIPAYIVYEDEDTIAFLDINPMTPGHTLVVPKEPTSSFLSVSEASLTKTLKTTQTIANDIIKRTGATGANILMNCNEVAAQSVDHFHIHIIPRYNHDEITFDFKPHDSNLKKMHKKLSQ